AARAHAPQQPRLAWQCSPSQQSAFWRSRCTGACADGLGVSGPRDASGSAQGFPGRGSAQRHCQRPTAAGDGSQICSRGGRARLARRQLQCDD
ncbi:unnamed protein product, partial [Polarella glacialis]